MVSDQQFGAVMLDCFIQEEQGKVCKRNDKAVVAVFDFGVGDSSQS